jgi:hypothetical protein
VPAQAVRAGKATVRRFGIFTEEQDAMVEWLRACQVRTVAIYQIKAAQARQRRLRREAEALGFELVQIQ